MSGSNCGGSNCGGSSCSRSSCSGSTCGDSTDQRVTGDSNARGCDRRLLDSGLEDGATADGVQFQGKPFEDVQCPRCDQSLELGLMDGAKVAVCHKCHGVLMQRPDFANTVQYRRANWVGDTIARLLDPATLDVPAHCPSCLQRMDTYPYAGPGAVVLDQCMACDLIWVDAGEITSIERAPGQRLRS